MRLIDIQKILMARTVCPQSMEREVRTVCGADLMSDVLAFTKESTLLLTGLTNIQVIRTAEISDLAGIVFVRGKQPSGEVIEMARVKGIPLLVTELPMYEACGLLYETGLKGTHPEPALPRGR